jgi:hypothetical protein
MEKSLSLNEIRTRAASFVIAWRDAKGDEKQEDQSFIRELLDVFGVSQTRAALYQKRAQRSSTGNQGYIDALVPGLVLIEMKSKGKNLGLAEIQALDYIQYLEEAEVPRYILTSDFKRFRLLDLHGHKGKDTAEFLLEELPKNIETLGFLAGYETRSFGNREQEEASIKAAKIMGDLYENLEGSGYGDHEASIFLVRTLFALYADDAGVWQKDLFTEFLKSRTATDGTDLGPQLTMLFQTLNQPLEKRLKNLDEILLRFPYVNGGIFAEPLPIPAFDYKMRNQLLKACDFNWSAISPAVFGSLFQAVKSQEARRELGEHYTTERNILKTIEPLFLDDLRSTYAKAINDAQKLRQLRERLSHIRILDPACGCGNFLVVSYREMRRIELLILSRLQELGDKTAIPTLFFERKDLAVKLENIKGIEIEEWPARIAQTALLLAEHQANIELEMALGRSPTVLPLETVTGIQIGNALTTDWRTVLEPSGQVIVLGNPPFLGHISRSHEQTEDLKRVWGRSDIGRLDFVSGWYKKAIDYFGEKNSGRFAFVSTNSISQGEPVPTLFRPIFEAGWRIRFAHQTFAWTSEAPGAAAVHCVIVGFDRESGVAELFTYANLKADPVASLVPNINAYLVAAPHILVEQRRTVLSPELLPVSMGSMPRDGGHLIINSREELDEVEKDPTAAKYIRRFIMGNEVINNIQRWCLWMVDLDPVDISRSEILKKRFSAVAESRLASSAESTRKMAQTPHLFGQRAQPTSAYVGIPKVFSENRKFATCDRFLPDVIAGDKVYTALDPDGFVFGVISSSMFITWQKLVGGRLESRPSFSNTIVWNNFPLPSTPPTLREAIVAAGENVQQVRAKFPTSSLADLYNPLAMDPSLLKAHAELDAVVDKAFGAQKRLHSSEEREQLLFEAFLRLSESEEEEGATRP